jgi:hypothetical protein
MLTRLLLAVTLALAVAPPAGAQGLLDTWIEPPDTLVRSAFASPYGGLVLKTFAGNVRKDGDAVCLEAKALDEAALVERGRALFQRHGTQTLKLLDEAADHAALASALSASVGPDAAAEFERLGHDGDVKALMALNRPVQLARAVDFIIEQFDRNILIKRIKLASVPLMAELGPDADAPTVVMRASLDRTNLAAVQQFLDKHPSRKLDRYLDLVDARRAALPKVASKEAGAKLSQMTFFAGNERDLAELCVGPR